MSTLTLYSVWHVNLAYSSIEEEERPAVIAASLWPLLETIRTHRMAAGIEMPSYTAEQIARLDPKWIAACRDLMQQGLVELIASGRAQLIGPLVPARVNERNLAIGQDEYERFFGVRPRIALVNEQALSQGLVDIYAQAGFSALFMECNNLASYQGDAVLKDAPHRPAVLAGHRSALPVLWNDTIAFQQFQRAVFDEIPLDAYRGYLERQFGPAPRCFPLYGNDAEIFGFVPGRYADEHRRDPADDWRRIDAIADRLRRDSRFAFALPSAVLEQFPPAAPPVAPGCSAMPVMVKKQPKYNITRWAVSGRNDLLLNTACHRLAADLADDDPDARWRPVCDWWASDYRTHLTASRWRALRSELPWDETRDAAIALPPVPPGPDTWRVATTAHDVHIATEDLDLHLNPKRGLAVTAATFPAVSAAPLVGTIVHGTFGHMDLAADFYSGHVVIERPGHPKATDLSVCTYAVARSEGHLRVSSSIDTPAGTVHKEITIPRTGAWFAIRYAFDLHPLPIASVRLGYLTVPLGSLDPRTAYFAGHNGGREPDRFPFGDRPFDHGGAVSSVVSCRTALGLTEGVLHLGDAHKSVALHFSPSQCALIGLLTHRPTAEGALTRCCLSAREMDETARLADPEPFVLQVRLLITAQRENAAPSR